MDRRPLAVGLLVGAAAAFLLRTALLSVGRVLLAALLFGAAAGVVALLTRPAAYPRTTVGVGRRVIPRPLPADFEGACVECGADAAGGRRRRFVEEFVVLGVPALLLDDGANAYCPSCADGGVEAGGEGFPAERRARSEEREST